MAAAGAAALPVNVDPLASRTGSIRTSGGGSHACSGVRSASPPATSCRSRLVRSGARRRAAESPRWRSSPWPLRREHLYLIAGRLAHGLPPAARLAALGAARGRGAGLPRRPLRRACGARRSVRRCGDGRPRLPRMRRATRRRATSSTPRCASSRATGRLHVFMPPLDPVRGLRWRSSPRSSEAAAALRHRGAPRGLPAAARPAHQGARRHARPRRDRGERPPGGARGASSSSTTAIALRRGAAQPPRRPRSSCSTAATPAPAAATTSRSAARTPADSPLLRRPDLLRSLVTYWQHHPSLSYLFSGPFVGPTSQAPRVDEARHDSALRAGDRVPAARPHAAGRRRSAAVARRPPVPQPARRPHRQHAPRRVLHRQAVLAPTDASGRLGPRRAPRLRDAAARADEPRARCCSCARWSRASGASRYARRWSAGARELHDRFMLPHFVAPDIARRRARPAARGYALRAATGSRRSSSSASRAIGTVIVRRRRRSSCARRSSRGTCSARRSAGTGTARYVDSSVERLQVQGRRASTARRHVVTCNGRRVPLRADRRARRVRRRRALPRLAAAVRAAPDDRRARAAGLRPRRHAGTAARSAAARITSSHPGGRSYETFPVNANEAEARRVARFWPHGPHARVRCGSFPSRRTRATRSRSISAGRRASPREEAEAPHLLRRGRR